MRSPLLALFALAAVWPTPLSFAAPSPCKGSLPCVLIATEKGQIFAEIDTVHAPVTGANFLRYVDERFFFGGTFGRTVRMGNQPKDTVRIEVIQAYGREQTETHGPIPLER